MAHLNTKLFAQSFTHRTQYTWGHFGSTAKISNIPFFVPYSYYPNDFDFTDVKVDIITGAEHNR